MRVAIFLPSITRCGPTNVVFNLVYYLTQCHVDVYLVYLWRGDDPAMDFISKYCKGSFELTHFNPLRIYKSFRYLLDIRPDVLHTNCMLPDIFGSIFKKLTSIPVVSTLHCNLDDDYHDTYDVFRRVVYSFLHKTALSKVNFVVAVSEHANRCVKNSINYRNINVIYNGVKVNGRLLLNCGISNRPKIVYFGRLVKLKNVDFLVRSILFFIDETHIDVEFHIIGDGPCLPELKVIAAGHDNIIFHGFKSNPLSLCDKNSVYVSASSSEGSPMAVLEALCVGLPCLLSDIPAHREIKSRLARGVEIFQMDNDSFARVLKKAIDLLGNQSSFGENIEYSQREFSAEMMSKKYIEIYNDVIFRHAHAKV